MHVPIGCFDISIQGCARRKSDVSRRRERASPEYSSNRFSPCCSEWNRQLPSPLQELSKSSDLSIMNSNGRKKVDESHLPRTRARDHPGTAHNLFRLLAGGSLVGHHGPWRQRIFRGARGDYDHLSQCTYMLLTTIFCFAFAAYDHFLRFAFWLSSSILQPFYPPFLLLAASTRQSVCMYDSYVFMSYV